MEMKDLNYKKWIAIGLGGVLGLSHLGMIGIISNKKPLSKFPQLNIPVSDYTSYSVQANEEGYAINYRANDPLVMTTTKTLPGKGGLFSKGQPTEIVKQYTMDGAEHHDGPVSTRSAWIDPSGLTGEGEKKISAKTIECIKAKGSGEGTGRMVGGSMGASVGSGLSSIPFVGWVLAGAASMIGMNEGAELGGNIAERFTDACVEEVD
tara:strand:- start:495 stop:1115 length:621 start_codon:yes stop_codon:yes gene_type:complete